MIDTLGTQVTVIAFRVEAGGRYGSGHLVRSLALAEELAERASVRFVVSASTAGVEQIDSRGFEVDVVGEVEGDRAVRDTVDALRAARVTTLVTDFDGISPAYLVAVRAALPGLAVVCLDDLSVPPGIADLLVRPHAVAAWRPAGPQVLHGPRYWVLRRAFDAWLATPRRPEPEQAARLLVMLGGAAPGDRLAALVRELATLKSSLAIDVIAGPLSDRLGELADAVAALGERAALHVAPPDLPAMMANADLAVVAAGYVLYELCALGTPTLALAQVEHQRVTLQAMELAGCVRASRASPARGFAGLAHEIAALADDRSSRTALARAGRALVDGQGRLRVAAEILGLHATRSWRPNSDPTASGRRPSDAAPRDDEQRRNR